MSRKLSEVATTTAPPAKKSMATTKNVFKEIVTSVGKSNLMHIAQMVKDQGTVSIDDYLKEKGYDSVPTSPKETKEFMELLSSLPLNVVLQGESQEYTVFDILYKTEAGISMRFAAPWHKDGTIGTDPQAGDYLRSGPDTYIIGAVAAHGDRMTVGGQQVVLQYDLSVEQSEEVDKPVYTDGKVVIPGLSMFGGSQALTLNAMRFDQKRFVSRMRDYVRLPSGKWIELGKTVKYTDSEVVNDIMFCALKDKNATKHHIDRDMKAVFTKLVKDNTVQVQSIHRRHSLSITKPTSELVGTTLHLYIPIQRATEPEFDKPNNFNQLKEAWLKKFPLRMLMRYGVAKGLKIQSEMLKAATPVVRAPTSAAKSMVLDALMATGLASQAALHQLVDGISANDKKSAVPASTLIGSLFLFSDEGHSSAVNLDLNDLAATIKPLSDGNINIDSKNEKNVNTDVGMYCILQATEPGDMDAFTKLAISEPELSNRLLFPKINTQEGKHYFGPIGTLTETIEALHWTVYELFNETFEEALKAEDIVEWFELETFEVDDSLEKNKLQTELRSLPYYILFRVMADKYDTVLKDENVDPFNPSDRDTALLGCQFGFIGRGLNKQFVCAFKSFNSKDSAPKAYLKSMDKHVMMPKLNSFIRANGYNYKVGDPYNSTVYFWDAKYNKAADAHSTFAFVVPLDKSRLETPLHVVAKIFEGDDEAMKAYNNKDIYYFLGRVNSLNAKRNSLIVRMLLEWEIRESSVKAVGTTVKEDNDEY